MRAVLALGLAALVSAGAVLVTPAPAGAATRQIAIGIAHRQDRNISIVDTITNASGGNAPKLWSIWSNWGENETKWFPGCIDATIKTCDFTYLNQLDERGITPVIWWQPATPGNQADSQFRYELMAQGAHDEYVRAWARQAKAWGKTVIIRFAHEMNGNWFPWGVPRFNNTPANFKAAWQRVFTRIKHSGTNNEAATNVKFLWAPYGLPCGSGCVGLDNIYPGNNWVDYVGYSRFNWGNPWQGLYAISERSMTKLMSLSNKPIIASEIASAPGPKKPQWITNGYTKLYNTWPRLVAIIYFHQDMTSQNQPDWRLNNPPEAFQAYAAIAGDPRFQGSLKEGSTPPPPPPPGGAQPPTATLISDMKMTAKMQVGLRISWPAVDGATAYELQQRINTNSWVNVPLSSSTALTADRFVKPARNVTYRVRANVGGTWTAWAQGPTMPLGVYQEQHAALAWTGSWTRQSLSGAYGGYVRHTNVASRKVTLSFNNTRSIAWVAARGPGRGIAEVWLDGAKVATIDLYQSALNSRYIAWSADVAPGAHTLEVRVTGTKRPAATNTRIDIDAFVVLR